MQIILKYISISLIPVLIVLISCQAQNPKEELEPVINKYVEFWNTGNFEGIEDVLHPEFELRMSPKFASTPGFETFKKSITKWRTAYPDFLIVLNEVIYDTDKAAALWTITATNTGEGSSPPTGKKVEVTGMSIVHFKNGKIIDEWISSNDLEWLQQLGYQIIPPSSE